MDHLSGWTAGHYYAGVMLTSTALASLLAMIQALASRAGGGFSLIAVLGLPLIIPVILVSTRYGSDLMRGIAFGDTAITCFFGNFICWVFRPWVHPLPLPLEGLNAHDSTQLENRGIALLAYVFWTTFTVPLGPGLLEFRDRNEAASTDGITKRIETMSSLASAPLDGAARRTPTVHSQRRSNHATACHRCH